MPVTALPPLPADVSDLRHAPCGVQLIAGQISSAPAVRRRLAELGLRAGARVTVMRRTSGGGAILALGDSRVAVSRTVLGTVGVRPASVEPAETASVERVETSGRTASVEPVESSGRTASVEPVETSGRTASVEPVETSGRTASVERVEPSGRTASVEPVETSGPHRPDRASGVGRP